MSGEKLPPMSKDVVSPPTSPTNTSPPPDPPDTTKVKEQVPMMVVMEPPVQKPGSANGIGSEGKGQKEPKPETKPAKTVRWWLGWKAIILWLVLTAIIVFVGMVAKPSADKTMEKTGEIFESAVSTVKGWVPSFGSQKKHTSIPEDVWRMRWNYQGQEYNLKVIITRRDENHLEMTAFGNYPSKIKMVKQSDTSEYKWIGEFRNPPCPGGFMKLNEKLVLGEMVYEGFQMGRDDSDWITATIEKAW